MLTGLAVAEACLLQGMPRFKTDPEVDREYQPYELTGVAFYFTNAPNAISDITPLQQRKRQALDCYRAQFTPESMQELQQKLEMAERAFAQGLGFDLGEPLKVLRPDQLHVGLMTQHS